MESKKLIKLNLAEKLKKRAYRSAFFRARAQDDTAANIRTLREKRQLSQIKLAELSGMKQSAISRIEQAKYSSWTYRTLQRVAEALNARLVVIFEPAEDVIARYEAMENFQSLAVTAVTSNPWRKNLAHGWQERSVEQGSSNQGAIEVSFPTNPSGVLIVQSKTDNRPVGEHHV